AIRQADAEAAQLRPAAPQDDFRPQSRLFAEPARPVEAPIQQAAPVQHAPAPIPAPAPAPQARMPRVEDFPPMVQAELTRAQPEQQSEDRGPMGLLKRLTNGLARREEEPARLQPAQPREPRLRPQVAQAPEQRRAPSADAQHYAPRRGQMDDNGRMAVQPRQAQEDDQLEIPAFLRRQAN
ncbi:MAG: cell division protein FtsZ, partial [Aliihoeflea sp.]